ncbi:MAG: potassium transporter Kup, partial [Pseudolabrys sp.]
MSDGASQTTASAQIGYDAPPGLLPLALGSVGVVYGDIGTSPLYAFREAAIAASADHVVTRGIVLGVLSLIVWALIITVTLKYVLILLRADNNGEGGTLSLTALATRALGRRTAFVFIVGVIGASMFLGDSVITPAISVLSAVEGLKLASPAFTDFVVPLTVIILIALFAAQSRGTAKVAAMFGPIMVVWFLSIAIAGGLHIRDDPTVLAAINPFYGIDFLIHHGAVGLVTLGAVFLVVTGGEALYADLGHFGRKPIQVAWLGLVLPALLINYFGQGAKVLADPAAIENPFYRLVPETFLLPMIVLATAATVIASQAVITGAYSLVHQAIQLGLLPRLAILHTSASHVGQIYIPRVTVSLMIGVLLLVGLFRTSGALASAYGIAVATTMVVDGILAFVVIWKGWRWPLWQTALLIVPFVIVDVVFFSANFLKLFEGAWAPLLFGASMVLLILTWRRGTGILISKTRRTEVPLDTLFHSLEKKPPHFVPGTAVFLTSDPEFAPTALLHNLKHNKVLHENNVILTIITADTPRVPEEERVRITPLS